MSVNTKLSEQLVIDNIDNEVTLRETIFKYIRYWRWFLLSIFIFLCLAYLYAHTQIPQYKVETDLLIKDDKNSVGGEKDLLKQLDLNSSNKIIDNEIQILKSNTMMEKVADQLELQTDYFIKNHISKKVLYKDVPFKVKLLEPSLFSYDKAWTAKLAGDGVDFNGVKVPFNHPVKTDAGLVVITPQPVKSFHNTIIYVNFYSTTSIAQHYIDNLNIDPASKDATVLVITLEDAVSQRGKDVLNTLVAAYNQAAVEDKNKTTANQLSFIEDRLTAIAHDLNTVEKNVATYKSSNSITDLTAEAPIFLQNVSDNDAQVSKLNLQLGVLDNIETYLKSSTYEQVNLPSTLGIDDPTLLAVVQQLGEAQLRRESLLRTIPETNPIVSSINDQIKALRQTIIKTIPNVRSGLMLSKTQLLTQGKKYNSIIKNVPTKERGLIDVMRQQDIKNSLFTYLLQKREETLLQLASTVADSRTIDGAKGSPFAIKPVKKVIYILFFLAGLILPFLIIYLIEALNFKVRKRSDIEKLTRAPILAEISHSDDLDPLVVIERPRSMVAEQIRAMRTNLQFISADQDNKVLLFTSNISGEGKSFVSLNLGASLATTGKKVVILELDLRKPKLHSSLGISNDQGISNYLIGKVDYKDIINPVPRVDNYYIITSGSIPPNPAELLVNGKIEVLIAELKKEFDFILLDAPPVGLVTDAQILGKWADATMFIIRHNYTIKNQIRLIDEFYTREVFKNLNIVFNSIQRVQGYGYSYGYGYGYGYGYYDEKPVKRSLLSKILGKAR